MTLPEGFVFNQGNLQDFVDCQRRFQLRHILHQSWPAVEAEPFQNFELVMEQGSRFHKIIRQHLAGVPENRIEKVIGNDEILYQWWNNYKLSYIDGLLGKVFRQGSKHVEELSLSIPMNKYRLIAKYDLVVTQTDGRLIIIDWKTSEIRPKTIWLEDRLQTHVYPFVLSSTSGLVYNSGQFDPGRIEMIYWFANFPEQPENIGYNHLRYEADAAFLHSLISEIDNQPEPVYPLTTKLKRCSFCSYRSLCNRGVKPGELDQLDKWQEELPPSEEGFIDFNQIGEIEF